MNQALPKADASKRAKLILVFLATAVSGCTTLDQGHLAISQPKPAALGQGRSLILASLLDARPQLLDPELGGAKGLEWRKGTGGGSKVLLLDQAPTDALSSAMGELMEAEGFHCVQERGLTPVAGIRLSGDLKEFSLRSVNASAFEPDLFASVVVDLTFERDGKPLVSKRLEGHVSGHPAYLGNPAPTLSSYISQASGKFLEDLAKYLASTDFQSLVQGSGEDLQTPSSQTETEPANQDH